MLPCYFKAMSTAYADTQIPISNFLTIEIQSVYIDVQPAQIVKQPMITAYLDSPKS